MRRRRPHGHGHVYDDIDLRVLSIVEVLERLRRILSFSGQLARPVPCEPMRKARKSTTPPLWCAERSSSAVYGESGSGGR